MNGLQNDYLAARSVWCGKLATDCRSKEHRPPIASNRCKSRVSLSLGKEKSHEQHGDLSIRRSS
jgi:hypothetical protein